mmetsp:Transcript_44910/g.119530  ORF Transcript_44910/g.119530 Transcript_44910/m.119530 type:complete len:179 (-) Transcript_44910:180-716(-)
MIICLGPICFPVWHLFPVLLIVFAKAKDFFNWIFGKKTEDDKKQEPAVEGDASVAEENKLLDTGLRQRKVGEGVITVHSSEKWDELMKESDSTTVFVCFTATWCKPCKELAPFFVELSKRFPNSIFAFVDVDECDEISANAGVKAMPTYQTYKSGGIVSQITGAFKDKLEKMVQDESS